MRTIKPFNHLLFILSKLFVIYAMFIGKIYSSQKDVALYKNDPDNLLTDSTQIILTIPIFGINEKFINNAITKSDTLSNDSFFIEAANGLINFECSKYFTLCSYFEGFKEISDSLSLFYNSRYSKLIKNKTDSISASALMKKTAEKFKTDFILIPYSCTIEHITIQPQGWRDAPSYQRPIKYYSRTSIHIQIWDKNGNLVYEKIGKNRTKRPVLYSLLKKKKDLKEGESIDTYAKRVFAPPTVRSLSKAIVNATEIYKKN